VEAKWASTSHGIRPHCPRQTDPYRIRRPEHRWEAFFDFLIRFGKQENDVAILRDGEGNPFRQREYMSRAGWTGGEAQANISRNIITPMLATLAAAVLVAFQFIASSPDANRKAEEVFAKAKVDYQAGNRLEQSGNIDAALSAYEKARADLAAPLPSSGLLANTPPGLTPDFAVSTLGRDYATGAVLASGIAVDELRLARLYDEKGAADYDETAEVNAAAVIGADIDAACYSGKPGLRAWQENPLPIHKAAAYFNLGMAQLWDNRPNRAKECFSGALRIDPTNGEAERRREAAAALSRSNGDDALMKAAGSILAAWIGKTYPPAGPYASAIIDYLVSKLNLEPAR
jgi:tetratricopeptide (TPR) repeat protein